MKKVKRLLSCVLAILMVFVTVPFAYAEESTTYEVGDIIEFGSYPQSKVVDETLIAELNALAPEWEEWTSYGYYSSMKPGDWMRYVDIKHNGEKYRGVKFTQYRPYSTTSSAPSSNFQSDNGYSTNTVYWFKFEPIDWRVLDPITGLVMCESIIDSQPYSNTRYSGYSTDSHEYNDASRENYASDYKTSSIKKWINEDFYNTAFSFAQQNVIQSPALNNGDYYNSDGTTDDETLDSNPANDKILLISYWDSKNSNFGFYPDEGSYDSARRAQGSDYALCQGLYVYSGSDSYYNGNARWLLGSAGWYSYTCCYVEYNGRSDKESEVTRTDLGIRPALRFNDIENFNHEHTYNEVITKQPTHLTEGEMICTCECGDTYTEAITKTPEHTYTPEITTPATHLTEGVTTFTCACGDTYTEAIAKTTKHTYTSEITTQPTHKEEGVKTFTCECGDSYTEAIAKTPEHTYTSEVTTEATHLTEGVTTFTCACGDTYTEAIAKTTKHTYTSEITTQPTHLTEGEKTFTCECGDSYTEAIAKLVEHTYDATVTAPTCTEQGYTTYTCECGDTYDADYTDKLSHEYTGVITTAPTHLTDGVKTYTCECGDNYTESIAKTQEHLYSRTVTAPTCTEQGYTTYTCVCGDTYDVDYVKANGHSYTSEVITPATHLTEGVARLTCHCGDSYTEVIAKTKEHTYTSEVTTAPTHLTLGVKTFTCACGDTYTEAVAKTLEHTYQASKITAPTCEEAGYTTYVCACGDSYKDNFVAEKGHTYSGQMCTTCGKKCSCNCHKSGFMGFIWKIILFFNKLFKTNKTCACGISHY